MEALEELNRPRGINRGIAYINGVVDQLPNRTYVRLVKRPDAHAISSFHSAILTRN
jgi:hypothetical protein